MYICLTDISTTRWFWILGSVWKGFQFTPGLNAFWHLKHFEVEVFPRPSWSVWQSLTLFNLHLNATILIITIKTALLFQSVENIRCKQCWRCVYSENLGQSSGVFVHWDPPPTTPHFSVTLPPPAANLRFYSYDTQQPHEKKTAVGSLHF